MTREEHQQALRAELEQRVHQLLRHDGKTIEDVEQIAVPSWAYQALTIFDHKARADPLLGRDVVSTEEGDVHLIYLKHPLDGEVSTPQGQQIAFSLAFVWLLRGKKVARAVWGAHTYLFIVPKPDPKFIRAHEAGLEVGRWIARVRDDKSLTPWIPQQEDLFANDWVIV